MPVKALVSAAMLKTAQRPSKPANALKVSFGFVNRASQILASTLQPAPSATVVATIVRALKWPPSAALLYCASNGAARALIH